MVDYPVQPEKWKGNRKMKAIVLAVMLPLILALGAMGQSDNKTSANAPTMKCTRPDGSACTSQRVQDLATAAQHAGKTGARPALSGVKILELSSSDGTLRCEQGYGIPCTLEQAKVLRDLSAASEMTITISGGSSK